MEVCTGARGMRGSSLRPTLCRSCAQGRDRPRGSEVGACGGRRDVEAGVEPGSVRAARCWGAGAGGACEGGAARRSWLARWWCWVRARARGDGQCSVQGSLWSWRPRQLLPSPGQAGNACRRERAGFAEADCTRAPLFFSDAGETGLMTMELWARTCSRAGLPHQRRHLCQPRRTAPSGRPFLSPRPHQPCHGFCGRSRAAGLAARCLFRLRAPHQPHRRRTALARSTETLESSTHSDTARGTPLHTKPLTSLIAGLVPTIAGSR